MNRIYLVYVVLFVSVCVLCYHDYSVTLPYRHNVVTLRSMLHECLLKSLSVNHINEPCDAIVYVHCAISTINTMIRTNGGEKQLSQITGVNVSKILDTLWMQDRMIRKSQEQIEEHPLYEEM